MKGERQDRWNEKGTKQPSESPTKLTRTHDEDEYNKVNKESIKPTRN